MSMLHFVNLRGALVLVLCWLFSLSLFLDLGCAFCPLPTYSAPPTIANTAARRSDSSTTRRYVFERMSEECVGAIVTAQEQAQSLQLPCVGCDVMMAGCIDHPETRAMERTLKQYGLTWRKVQATLKEIYREVDASDESSRDKGWLSGFQAAKTQEDRPFSKNMKQKFTAAGQLADRMGSPTVSSHHLFLALLGYSENSKHGPTAATGTLLDDELATEEGWALLLRMGTLDENVTALKICESLIKNLQEQGGEADPPELVTGRAGNTKTPTLAECGTDLTQMAQDGLLDPVYGRDDEIRSCLRTLIRRRKNNACLIGEPGVGKTAIAEGIAQILIDPDRCPARLQGHRLVSLELSSLVAGTKYRGEFEERLQDIIREVTDPKAPPTILFLDEIHNVVGAGAAEGGMDAANLLKPALARGAMQLIGATTISEYRKYIEKDAALERRLQPIMVKESSIKQTIRILQALQSNYERHHGVKYTPAALEAAAALSERYITDRFLPDKALDLLDEAGAVAHLESHEDETPAVTEHTIAALVSEMTGIPIGKLESKEKDRLTALESQMGRRVVGQSRAVRGVARAVRRARSGLRDPGRPVASFLFCGPTGTGKTELCKTLADTYYGSEKDMIRIDMTEYMEKHSVSRLTGPPPGYIGFEEGGQLTEAVRRAPHSVLLLDEVEKAHGDVLNILLQIMEDGILTDGKGRTVNFKNTILVMTSNVGSKRILDVTRGTTDSHEAAVAADSWSGKPPSSTSHPTPKPISPEEALKRIQNNPKASSLLLQASSDPEIMGAIRTAMNGSPADLLRKSRESPTVARFLEQLWAILDDSEEEMMHINGDSESASDSQKSGLGAIRSGLQESLSQWNDSGVGKFTSGLLDELEDTAESNPTTERQPGEVRMDHRDHVLYSSLLRVVKEELENAMKPELLNRIDEIVVFSPLSIRDLKKIACLLVEPILDRARDEQGMELEVGDDVMDRIVYEGSQSVNQFGARPMRRAAQRFVEDSLSDAILQDFLKPGDSASLHLKEYGEDNDGSRRQQQAQQVVVVRRMRDNASLEVFVEDASGIDGARSVPVKSDKAPPNTNQLATRTS